MVWLPSARSQVSCEGFHTPKIAFTKCIKSLLQRAATALLLCASAAILPAREAAPPALFQQGLEQVRDGKYKEALETSGALEKSFPKQPFAALVAMESYWGMIYCRTGHINSREIWNLADQKTSSYDKPFFEAIQKALDLSREMRRKPESAAAGALYAGLAHGARSRLYALREQGLTSASEAKQMRADLLEAVAKDPQLEPDAGLGLGTYNYYADALSPILKLFRFLLGIPGGNRERGFEQLRISLAQSAVLGDQAKFELARIYGVREGRHAEALKLFQELAARYPDNSLYTLSAAMQAEAAGQTNAAIGYAQKSLEAASKMEPVCRERFLGASQGSLERLQGKRRPAK
jgi:hypothetical protein